MDTENHNQARQHSRELVDASNMLRSAAFGRPLETWTLANGRTLQDGPGWALALADWLDTAADHAALFGYPIPQALAVARATTGDTR